VKGEVIITDQNGKVLFEDHNDTTPFVAEMVALAIAGNIPGNFFSVGLIRAQGDFGNQTAPITYVETADGQPWVISKATFSPSSFTGNITQFSLETQNLVFSNVTGLSIDKAASTAITVTWKITFNIV